jgi:putative Mg2+ transporter-C (MgtC) family protein
MLTLPDIFYDLNIFSTTLRLVLAAVFGGVIGLERGANKHPAGFRTHILVCVGATLAMLTNQFIVETMAIGSDPARLGAQVITGVGFLGVGTIFVTGKSKIKGLTTAAGLWASACLGLALGIGFYSGALISGILIFVSLALLPKVENYFYSNSRILDLYIEIDSFSNFKDFKKELHNKGIMLYETNLSNLDPLTTGGINVNLEIRLPRKLKHQEVLDYINDYDGISIVEEV